MLNTPFHLETAAFAAWPALETQNTGPWHLRFADGYTKRANSANLLKPAEQLSPDMLRKIEAAYRERRLPPIFRLASFAASSAIDNTLADHGYRLNDVTQVQTLPLTGERFAANHELSITMLPIEQWFTAFQHISGKIGAAQSTHLRILQAIQEKCAFAVLHNKHDEAVCCGLVVVSGPYCGLFDIATAAHARQQGLATRLCADLLHWGKQQGATTAYLQVTAHNLAAINVYERLGFRRAYQYWYRVGTL